MPNKLSERFGIFQGSNLATSVPGVAGGKFLDLNTIAQGGALGFSIDDGSGAVHYTAVTEVAPETNSNVLCLQFTFATLGTHKVYLRKSPAGSPSGLPGGGTPIGWHLVDFSSVNTTGYFMFDFFVVYHYVQTAGWRYLS